MNPRDLLSSVPALDPWTLAAASGALAATVVAGAALALCRLLRGRSVPLRHAILCAAVGVVVLAVPAGVAARHLGVGLVRIASARTRPALVEATFAATAPAPVAGLPDRPRGFPEPVASAAGDGGVARAAPTSIRPSWRTLAVACCLAWAAGTLVGGLLLIRDLAMLRRFTRSLCPCPDRSAGQLLDRAARSVGLARPPRLCDSPAAVVPLVMGTVAPVVVLPAGLSRRLSPEQLSAILVHETAHVAHGDLWIAILQRLAAILFWWCPPVHAVNRRLADLRELICDNHVLRSGGDGRALAEALVDLAGGMPAGGGRLAAVALGVVDERAGLGDRVERLVRPDGRDTATRLGGAALVAACGFALAALSLVAATSIRAAEAPAIDVSALAADEVAAIDAALEWIAGQQDDDGGWTFAVVGPHAQNRVAATSLAILPFLGRGHTHRDGPYKDRLAKGIGFLADRVTEGKGNVLQKGVGVSMYSQGLAGLALCRAYAATNDEALAAPAQAALDFIVEAQDPVGGGWRYVPKQPGDTSVLGWQFAALASGKAAGLTVDPLCIARVIAFLDGVQWDGGAAYGYNESGKSPACTAIGLLVRSRTGWKLDDERILRGANRIAAMAPRHDLYFDFYASQLLHAVGGEGAAAWRDAMRRLLLDNQVAEGDGRGSWFEGVKGGHGPSAAGRLYCTAMATMILEAPLAPRKE